MTDTRSIRQIGVPAPEPAVAEPERPREPRPPRIARMGAPVVGVLDGLLAAALPFAAITTVALVGWAGLGARGSWTAAIGTAAVAWLLGHGVDVAFPTFTATAAGLGPGFLTAVLGARAGRRAARTGAPLAAWAAALVAFGVATCAILPFAHGAGSPVAWQAVLPVLLFAVPATLGLRAARASAAPLPAGVRAGLGAAAILVGGSAALLGLLLLVRLPDVVVLWEALAPGPAGSLALTGLQLLLLPTAVAWVAAWCTGAPVVLGTGSVTSALGGQVGPLPALPLLGVVPAHPSPVAAVAVLLPVLAGFAAGALARRAGGTGAIRIGVGAGLTAGVLLGAVTALSSGAAGPGRFAAVGPDALVVTALVALEVGLPAVLGAAVVRTRERADPPTE